jgi:hypothetical protein
MNNKTTPKDFFIHLGAIVALYFSVISLINLLFAIVHQYFPDPLAYDNSVATLRWTISSLVVLFPIYLLLTKYILKGLAKFKEKKEMWVRKWSSFLTLFLTGTTMVVDLIITLNYFLGGEVTTRFVLKAFVVLIVAGFVFYYYLNDLKRDNFAHSDRTAKFMRWSAIVVVVLSIIVGVVSVGSPTDARKARLDERRTQDLYSIQFELINYWQKKQVIPTNLTELNDPISSFVIPTDPETGMVYEYSKLGDLNFELCADFALSSQSKQDDLYTKDVMGSFQHQAGRQCFERTIDPELYPPFQK